MLIIHNSIGVLIVGILAAAAATLTWAQTPYPNVKPISITVGLQAGTGSDVAVRAVADKLGAVLKQSVVVENLPGAGGMLAAQKGITTTPDGYHLVALSSAAITVAPNLEAKAPYDPLKDLEPVAMIASIPSVLFVRSDLNVKTVQDFIQLAKEYPGKLTYASGGTGSAQHLAGEQFKAMAGIDVLHIPYKGSGQATLDVVGGRVDGGFQGLSTVLGYIKAGKLRALASSGHSRASLLPEVKTLQEVGVENFYYEPWTGLFAPVGTPPEIITRINSEVRKITNDRQFKERWVGQGLSARDDDPQTMKAQIKNEFESHKALIRKLHIQSEKKN